MAIGNNIYGINVVEKDLEPDIVSASIVSPVNNVELPDGKTVTVQFDIDSGVVDGADTGTGDLVIKLRLLDYCDQEGNKQKILVLASQPFNPS